MRSPARPGPASSRPDHDPFSSVVRPLARAYRAGMNNPDMTDPTPNSPTPNSNQERAEETLGSPVPEGRTDDAGSLQRDPDDWVTGDEPMTEAQKSYLDTLAREAGEELPATLTKAEASEHIDRLQKNSPRTGHS